MQNLGFFDVPLLGYAISHLEFVGVNHSEYLIVRAILGVTHVRVSYLESFGRRAPRLPNSGLFWADAHSPRAIRICYFEFLGEQLRECKIRVFL